jgi:hypothetical protein
MKKNIIFLMIALSGFLFIGVQSANAQIDGPYQVSFGWDDSNCNCSDPVTKLVRVVITTYPGGLPVDDSDWDTPSGNPETYDGETELIDCGEPCYTVTVFVVYLNNSVPCCSGYSSENVRGEQLDEGYEFPDDIIMN